MEVFIEENNLRVDLASPYKLFYLLFHHPAGNDKGFFIFYWAFLFGHGRALLCWELVSANPENCLFGVAALTSFIRLWQMIIRTA
jgi:apolipoprotein N-acyltransferase